MSEYIHIRHNKNLLLYHKVSPIKYRRTVLSEPVEMSLVEICKQISERYEIHFVKIGADDNHVHFLIQSVPKYSVEIIVRTVKSDNREGTFSSSSEVKNQLWGGQFWTSGYYVNTISQYANEDAIQKYIQNQGNEKGVYKMLHKSPLSLFE